MFGIGTTEFLVIILVAVVVLGPEHLPKIVRTFGKVMSDIRKVSTDFQRTMNLEASQDEWKEEQEKKKKKRAAAARPQGPSLQKSEGAERTPSPDGSDPEPDAAPGAEQAAASSDRPADAPEGSSPGGAA